MTARRMIQSSNESMRLGKPAGMACSIITEETAMKNFKAGKYDDHKVFVVCEDPNVFLGFRKRQDRRFQES